MIYVICGHLGSGKTLCAVTLAVEEYLWQGRRVASNMSINLDEAMPKNSKTTAIKLPGVPTVENLDELGTGYDLTQPYDESKFGLILLDEAGTWLNSRDWADKGRRQLFRWITHARKLGWDVALIIQDFEALDTQIRRSVTEIYVSCARTDRIKMPYLPIRLPKKFMAIARYKGPNGAMYKWWFSSALSFPWYDTRQSVLAVEEIEDAAGVVHDMRGPSSMLSAWHLRGRYLPPSLGWKDWAAILYGMAVLITVGVLIEAAAGRSPGVAASSAWRRFRATRVACVPSLTGQPHVAG